jgi:cytochrome o ubiquinol oxidase subunit IV
MDNSRLDAWYAPFKSYLFGFLLSILLTGAAYLIVTKQLLSGSQLSLAVIGLCLIQAVIQFRLFLHLGTESKPHWNLIFFLFMLFVLAILLFGSLWIMHNLNYQVMPQHGTILLGNY